MASNRNLVLIAAILLIAIAGLAYYLVFGFQPTVNPAPQQSFKTTILANKPDLSGQFVKNPDLIYSSYGWLSSTPENLAVSPTVLNVSSDWSGNGFMTNSVIPLGNRTGIAVIHPINTTVGRYISQSSYLPPGSNYLLYLGVTDAADLLQALGEGGGYNGNCADVGIKAVITDNTKNNAFTVFDQIIRNGRWYDYSVDLGSTFSGDNITISVQSYAADGGCGMWNGEYAAVDYVDIAKV